MAYVTTSRSLDLGGGLASHFSRLVAKTSEYMARRRVYNVTLAELRSLSDRELNDIGMSRSMIKGVALDAARMAKLD